LIPFESSDPVQVLNYFVGSGDDNYSSSVEMMTPIILFVHVGFVDSCLV